MRIKIYLIIVGIISISGVYAQIPNGYYNAASGKWGDDLRSTLSSIIDQHSAKQYDDLWIHFGSTDRKVNGKVWDMYSDQPGGTPAYEYTYTSDQCGNSSQEGDCYNREHSMPKSWFNDGVPMYTDLFHLYPTDGFVNNIRGNLPFGETNNPNKITTNGSKRGNNNTSGYSGEIFEPIDEYKGDFARSYFYMLTRYMNQSSSWSSPMLNGNNFSSWAKELLIQWDTDDSVSQKEIDRNNAIYQIQGNRNPYIDVSDYVYKVWVQTTAVNDLNFMNKVQLFPNPVTNKLSFSGIDYLGVNVLLNLYTITGELIQEQDITTSLSIDLSTLSPGIYFVSLRGEKGSAVRKVVKK